MKPSAIFKAHALAAEKRRSALELVRVIVLLDIDLSIKRRMLSHCIWHVTETEGASKYRTRFMSAAAIGKQPKVLHHEHVIPRKVLVDAMIAEPDRAQEIAGTAVGCTVTREEHATLSRQDKERRGLTGWERYRAAGVVVIDTTSGIPI